MIKSINYNTCWNIVGNYTPMLFAAASIPFLLNHLGEEKFGALTLIWTLIGFTGLFDFGTGKSVVYFISKGNNPIITAKIGVLFGSCISIIATLVFYNYSDTLATFVTEKISSRAEITSSFQIISFLILPNILMNISRGVLEAQNRFKESNHIKILLGSSTFLIPALSISIHGSSLITISGYFVVARLILMIVSLYKIKTLLKHFKIRVTLLETKKFLNYSLWIGVTSVIGPLMVYGDRFIISNSLGTALLVFYSIPQEFLQRLLLLPAALSSSLLPVLSSKNKNQVKDIYRKNKSKVVIYMGIICTIIILFNKLILTVWISPDFSEKSTNTIAILSLGIWFNSVAQIPYVSLHANGYTRLTAMFHSIQLPIYLIITYILIQHIGIEGAAIAWTVRAFSDYLMLSIATKRILHLS